MINIFINIWYHEIELNKVISRLAEGSQKQVDFKPLH